MSTRILILTITARKTIAAKMKNRLLSSISSLKAFMYKQVALFVNKEFCCQLCFCFVSNTFQRFRCVCVCGRKIYAIINESIVSVCLLSVLLLLPYCCKGCAPLIFSLGGVWLAMYTCFVLPILISANYKYPVRWIKHIFYVIPSKYCFANSLVVSKTFCLLKIPKSNNYV